MNDSTNRLGEERDVSASDQAVHTNQSVGDEETEFGRGSSKASASGMVEDRINALETQLAKTKAELEKFRDLALRSSADLDNYRKRMSKEREEAIKFANSSFLERLIPILDNFEFGLEAARSASSPVSILEGMKMVQKQIQDFLSSAGIEMIDATGQHFDPQLHEAISQEESKQVPDGIVIRQLRRGYKLRDRLIRPANVVVSKGAPKAVPGGPTET
ncbi:MAG TPA: nucleotide exchange factor GrpE [Chthoniobacterales bacterium]|nr:nucleotide exchange factor GrpE [Chthoniobacterales bacterium]